MLLQSMCVCVCVHVCSCVWCMHTKDRYKRTQRQSATVLVLTVSPDGIDTEHNFRVLNELQEQHPIKGRKKSYSALGLIKLL